MARASRTAGADLEIRLLLERLTQARHDELAPLWQHVAEAFEDGDCRRALRTVLGILIAHQRGRLSRDEGKDPQCPYAVDDEVGRNANAILRQAWLAGNAFASRADASEAPQGLAQARRSDVT